MADPSVCEPLKNIGLLSPKLEDFEVLNIIGAGSFGTCYRVKCKLDDNIYVWKAIDYGHMNDNKKLLLVSEVNLLSELKHPNIVRYYDRILHKETTTLFIIMECCQGGDLASVISTCKKNHTYVEESFIWQVLYQTARALQACHSHLGNVTVLHRDIKPANVFLDSDGNVKLGDFGLARILKNNEAYSETIVGTPYYMSPEVLKGGKYNRKSDIWALGCLIYELCALSPPFLASSIKQLVSNIKNGRFNRIPSHYSDDLHKMIEFMLSLDHEYRPTIEMILHHPTVVLHVSQRCISKFVPYKSSASNEIIDRDINEGVKQISFTEREPQTVSEKTFKEKWLSRLEALRDKEANLRAREENLLSKERSLIKKEKHLLLLERLAKEKVLRAEVYLRQCKENKSVCSSANNRLSKIPTIEEIDTSFSADPGDTSILPTSTKIDPLSIPKPNQFFRSASERRRPKHVHFDVLSNADFICDADKAMQNKANKPAVLHNHNKTENKTCDRNTESYTEERAVWLENKRIIYNTVEKENNDVGENLNLHSAHTGTIRKKINRSLFSVFTKKKVLNLR